MMRVGRIVEIGRTAEVLNHPTHPYTNALLAAVPGRGELGKAGRIYRRDATGQVAAERCPPGRRYNP
jgi:oligopeptide/dipeptide ABC transporter ATP-binding protein